MRTVGIVAAGLAVLLGWLAVGSVAPARAQALFGASVSPSSGPAGSPFTISWYTDASAWPCKTVSFSSQLTALPTTSWDQLSLSSTVPPSTAPGSYAITARCGESRRDLTFTVTRSVPTTPPPPSTTTVSPDIPPPTTTTPPRVTPTRTAAPSATTPTTAPPSTTPTAPPPTTSQPPITSGDLPRGDLRLDRASINPGDELTAEGEGCAPGSDVVLSSGGERVGTARADDKGEFTAGVEFTRVEPGRHLVTADCGVRLSGSVDQVVTSSVGGGASSTLVVLVFFVLACGAVARFA
ncbi:hypothetical protein [Actinokineospora pegani]|uniref:hypothetical protein n=1 Tax=Actinokineospora pegani TaxID=2654637 RepID=UPI001F1F63C8|nr:hypothetical protein [Actinokineospora pegani]